MILNWSLTLVIRSFNLLQSEKVNLEVFFTFEKGNFQTVITSEYVRIYLYMR